MSLAQRVVEICLPVFALVALGMVLRRSGMLQDQAQAFLNRFVYIFSLPALIFLGVAHEELGTLLAPAVIVPAVGAALLAAVGAAWLAPRLVPQAGPRAVLCMSACIANVTYLGFPLAENTFGQQGLIYAAIVNAFAMPTYMLLTVFFLARGSAEPQHLGALLWRAASNPVVGAAFLGLACSGALHEGGLLSIAQHYPLLSWLWTVTERFLAMLGQVGLPLALIAVGGALRFDRLRGDARLLLRASITRLLITPTVALVLARVFFPSADPAATGTAVLLSAMPLAVTGYVLADQMGVEAELTAGVLVLSTLLACLTIPLWIALLIV